MNDFFNTLRTTLYIVSVFIVWIPVLVWLLFVKKSPLYIRLLLIHLVFAGVVQGIALYLWKHSRNNLWLVHIYAVEELVMLSLFYSELFKKKIGKRVFISISIIFLICAVLNALYLQPITTHNTYIRSLGSLVIIIWTIIYFYRRLADEEEYDQAQRSRDLGLTWMNSGFLVYFSFSLLLFTLSNFMSGKEYRVISKNLWAGHAVATIFLYLTIAIGLWKHRKIST